MGLWYGMDHMKMKVIDKFKLYYLDYIKKDYSSYFHIPKLFLSFQVIGRIHRKLNIQMIGLVKHSLKFISAMQQFLLLHNT